MSETLLAVIIGGAIAIIGGFITQLTLFWLNDRKEKQARRQLAIEHMTRAILLPNDPVGNVMREVFVQESGDTTADAILNTANKLSDDQVSIIMGVVKAGGDFSEQRKQKHGP